MSPQKAPARGLRQYDKLDCRTKAAKNEVQGNDLTPAKRERFTRLACGQQACVDGGMPDMKIKHAMFVTAWVQQS